MQNILREHDDTVLGGGRKKDSFNGMTSDEVLKSPDTLVTIDSTGGRRLTAVTKNIRGSSRFSG